MSKFSPIGVLVVAALVIVGSLTAWQVAASADLVSDDTPAAATGLENRVRPVSQDTVAQASPSRAQTDECYDVSLSEVAECRSASQNPIPVAPEVARAHRLPPNVCFDVPLGEICDE